MEFWIPLLGGALGAAIINGAFGWWKHRAERRVEHEKWLRDQRQEAYVSFMRGVSDAVKLVYGSPGKTPDYDGIEAALRDIKPGMIRLVAPKEVIAAADAQYKTAHCLAQAFHSSWFKYYPEYEGTPQQAVKADNAARTEYLRLCRMDLYPDSKREEAAATTTDPQPQPGVWGDSG